MARHCWSELVPFGRLRAGPSTPFDCLLTSLRMTDLNNGLTKAVHCGGQKESPALRQGFARAGMPAPHDSSSKLVARSSKLLLVHVSHAATVSTGRRSFLLFRNLRDQGFGGEHQGRDRASILQRGAYDLRRVEHTGLDQIFVVAGLRVV